MWSWRTVLPTAACTVMLWLPSWEKVNDTAPSRVTIGYDTSRQTEQWLIMSLSCQEVNREKKCKAHLCFVLKPPVVGDCAHVAGQQHGGQVHRFVLHCHRRSRELDLLELTFSRENTRSRVTSVELMSPQSWTWLTAAAWWNTPSPQAAEWRERRALCGRRPSTVCACFDAFHGNVSAGTRFIMSWIQTDRRRPSLAANQPTQGGETLWKLFFFLDSVLLNEPVRSCRGVVRSSAWLSPSWVKPSGTVRSHHLQLGVIRQWGMSRKQSTLCDAN